MDIKKIEALIKLAKRSGVAELEVKEDKSAVRINLIPTNQATQISSAPIPVSPVTTTDNLHKVMSPMVGTMYTATSPGAEPFVTIGQTVKPGDTLCIIEAMKMMNHIEADKAGTIKKVFVENGQPVEFEQPLFAIE